MQRTLKSQPARAVWIEIYDDRGTIHFCSSSQPARAVWIEITANAAPASKAGSQPARAVWIEIMNRLKDALKGASHSLRGLCGLKFMKVFSQMIPTKSQPARAVWIEIKIKHL